MPFNIGENVGPYRVTEQLGRGGMATVYKAYHANLDRYVALKVLHPAFLEDENFLARFQREARLVAKLEHPNIVPVYDFAEHEGQPYLVMKFVEGETLKAFMNHGHLDVEQIWNVVEAVGAGLGYAHKQGILHRDIKPSNVIVSSDGQMYLADFGLARIAEMGESTLSGDMIMGTPQYISPEQAMGVKDLDGRTDIYSFAVILYEMVVGQVPFSADTPFSIIHDHIYSPLPLPKTVNPSVPEEVERVLLKALAKERDDRYQSVEELVQAFKNAWDESDVDMAEVTMTKPIADVATKVAAAAPSANAPEPALATVARVSGTSPTDTADPADTGAVPSPKKKKKIWLYALGGIVFICLCIVAIGIITERQEANIALDAPMVEENLPLDEEAAETDLEDLREWVEDAPDDPFAHVEYAIGLYQAQKMKLASEELNRALDLAGPNVDVYYHAGYSMMENDVWGAAAFVFMRALQNVPPNATEAQDFVDLLHESLYKAAVAPDMLKALPYDEMMQIDEPMLRIAETRHTFYHGDAAEAWQMLDRQKKVMQEMAEIRLLEAEMNMREGKRERAAELYESLVDDEFIPFWIVEIATDKLENMP